MGDGGHGMEGWMVIGLDVCWMPENDLTLTDTD